MSQGSQANKLNFYENFLDSNDIDVLKELNDERIELYGYPCILLKYEGSGVELDSLYGDIGSKQLETFKEKKTFYYCDYKNLQELLYSYGLSINQATNFNGMMKLEDNPKNGDLIYFIRRLDDDIIKCEITNCALYKNICYLVDITITMYDLKSAGNV
ncbi:MAG: hypothetical protein EOL97_12165 [Spirochaetia bacterium]|nr:hypothetical protein [Spirochaetia bacterium]